MVSILVCSIKPDLYQQLAKNVEETIGVNYELLRYDNRQNNKGLCEVYNLLAKDAKFDILCFVHEDVIFTTMNWGETLEKIFRDDIAVVGVAGGKYKSKKFSGWFTGVPQLDCANIIHRYPNREEKMYLQPTKNASLDDVVCVDGVFICCTRHVWNEIKFDSVNIKGFHFYDIDFSVRAAKKYRVAVTYEIEMIHITKGGDYGDPWVEAAINYHQRNSDILPFSKYGAPPNIEELVARTNLDLLKTFPISLKNKIKWVRLQGLWRNPSCYYEIIKFFIYSPLRLKYVHNLFKSK